MAENETLPVDEAVVLPSTEKSWIGSICGYFRDFLDTDFKKTRAPKRQISSRDRTGLLTGVQLSKYPDLTRDLWECLSSPFGSDMLLELSIRRGKYKSRLSDRLISLINKHVDSITDEQVEAITSSLKSFARMSKEKLADDPERFSDQILGRLKSELLNSVVNPLLGSLDTFFQGQGNESLETIYNLEEELGDLLIGSLEEPIGSAVASAIVDDDFDELDGLIGDACQTKVIRSKFIMFFEGFATSDFYRDLSELRSTLKLKDNFQIYVYVTSLRFGKTNFPLFYFPVEVSQSNSIFTIKIDPHILINKKAIDFGVGEVARSTAKPIAFTLDDRILYVSEGQSMISPIQTVLDEFCAALSMDGAIDLHEGRPQKISRSDVVIDNALHFAAFDQSDESLLNDYEELLDKINIAGGVGEDFKELIASFMGKEAVSLEAQVDEEWINTPVSERLVYDSPVPLNEEQRKILSALNSKEGKYIAVEGPPGTGKSHTISAVVFDAIFQGKNVLILSDKKEALDVAERKITSTLSAVRLDDKFQDPILRLGKQGSTYAKILATKTVEQMRQRLTVAKANSGRLEEAISLNESSLKKRIQKTQSTATSIELSKIHKLENDESKFSYLGDEPEYLIRDDDFRRGVRRAGELLELFDKSEVSAVWSYATSNNKDFGIADFFSLQDLILKVNRKIPKDESIRDFGSFRSSQIKLLGKVIDGLDAARKPIIGFLFSGSEVRRLARELKDEFNYKSAEIAHKRIERLRSAEKCFRDAIQLFYEAGIRDPNLLDLALYQFLNRKFVSRENLDTLQKCFADLQSTLKSDEDDIFSSVGLGVDNIKDFVLRNDSILVERINSLSDHFKNFDSIKEQFLAIPEIDYADELHDLQELQAQRLADSLDARVVTFANTKKNKAAQIKTIIQKKQKFPKELFEDLSDAFPVMIAGIRDYAEYVPLERELFDLIIIDEASQVSIAQALPAFIRAKKVLVLGDRNQFSNVKTNNASKAINQSYQARILEQFRQQAEPDVAMLNQIKMFDIKTSVLEFVERIANLKIMLRKHFRGYPELIGFSSRYFYGGGLQAMKIRGRPIDEVIKFRKIEHDGLHEISGNTNSLEAKAIVERLRELSDLESVPDVCVITPFNEQQRLIHQEIQNLSGGQDLVEKLRLRIFTFDTCQGEEADICIYSMVASPLKDRLNYIFAKDISKSDEVEENLRLQRLDVGFSRAKECMEIYHSKDISDMSGGIQIALNHYQNELEKGRKGPEVSDVDPNSPMELQVLNWLRDVPLFDELDDQVEVDAQFELGAYLNQLDPTYQHPNYKVDFLVKVTGDRETAQIIIEYDGFKEHFTDLDEVDASNYEFYMKPEDVERQKILEGYGYRFLRINRFTIGKAPVKTLDERLRRMLAKFDVEREPPTLIEEHKKLQQALREGDSKACSRCSDIKPIEEFFDQSLKNGEGAHGRVCLTCKAQEKTGKNKKGKGKTKSRKKTASSSDSATKAGRVYLKCPYSEKNDCKALGAKWDAFERKWFIPAGMDPKPFARWI